MATTTNFGWETPDDTDLVKDGAAAIRTLGSAIDTSLVDLKGGTTGQVLSKTSNTDMDFTWVTSDDANAIQNTIVDAKGDLISASAADVPARLAVGANDTLLIADSAQSTGLKWAGGWTTWTPTYTNLTVGNGTVISRYQQIGKTVYFEYRLVFGTTTVMGSVPQISMPVTPAFNNKMPVAYILDSGTANYVGFVDLFSSKFYPTVGLTNGTYLQFSYLDATVPFTWTTNDTLAFNGTYEAA